MLLCPSLIGSAVCNCARMTCVWVDDHDPAHCFVEPLAHEGDLCPIGRPLGVFVVPALGRVGDFADMTSVWVHREEHIVFLLNIYVEIPPKGDLTVPGSTTARALVVIVFVIVSATGENRHSHGHHRCGHR